MASKRFMAAALLCVAAASSVGAQAAGRAPHRAPANSVEELPLVTNEAQRYPSASARIDGLTDEETQRLDNISAGAAARAVLALRCESAQFERVSRGIESMLDKRAKSVSERSRQAKLYARDSAKTKYRAFLAANPGVGCGELASMRALASSQGFAE